MRGTRSSGRSTSAQNKPFIAIPRNSLTRTRPPVIPGKYPPGVVGSQFIILHDSNTKDSAVRQCTTIIVLLILV